MNLLPMIMGLWFGFVVAAILLVAEYLLCTRFKNPLLGGIIPVLILVGSVCILASGKVPLELKTLFPLFVANAIYFGEWAAGREKYQKRQQSEIDKMRAKDIE